MAACGILATFNVGQDIGGGSYWLPQIGGDLT